jgi:hypothetical protein
MSILNRASDGLLSVLVALRNALVAYGPQAEGRLLELAAPASVVTDGKPDMAKKTLTRWKQLGFFDQVDGSVALTDSISAVAVDDLDGLRRVVLRLVLSPENNTALTGEGKEEAESSNAADLTRALAWALAQDPFSFPAVYKDGVEVLQHSQGIRPPVFVNDTRWQGFAEWAVFVGVAWVGSKVFVPSPAFAVRSMLKEVFRGVKELPHADFFERLAICLPIVDGGKYRELVERQVAAPWRKQLVNEISPTLSSALLTLEAEGTLRLEQRSDASARMLIGRTGRELRSLSHVLYREAAPW